MPATDLYPSDITESERHAGFAVVRIENPDSTYFGHPATIEAVVHAVDASHRIIKMRDPLGNDSYKFQRFGKHDFQRDLEKSEWKPFGIDAAIDPPIAIQNVTRLHAESLADESFIVLVPPALCVEEEDT